MKARHCRPLHQCPSSRDNRLTEPLLRKASVSSRSVDADPNHFDLLGECAVARTFKVEAYGKAVRELLSLAEVFGPCAGTGEKITGLFIFDDIPHDVNVALAEECLNPANFQSFHGGTSIPS